MDEVHSYVYALKYFKAFAPCDNTFHQFVLQDYNLVTADLKVTLGFKDDFIIH